MGLSKKSLMALGLRSEKELLPFKGGYRHRKIRTRSNGELYYLCYTKDLSEQFEMTIDNRGLYEMGLIRDEQRRGQIVEHGERIEPLMVV